jgi:hypothetical protein
MIIPYIKKEWLLNRITEQQIFIRYLGIEPNLVDKFTNPLREDKNADCVFYVSSANGSLRFKDFAYGFNWSCFDIVMQLNNCNFTEALIKIAIDFNLIESDKTIEPLIVNSSSTIPNKPKINAITKIDIKKRRFNQQDIDYWGQFCLEPKDLFYVFPTEKLWLNTHPYYKHTETDPCYTYALGLEKRKAYFPFREKGNHKKPRFLQTSSEIEGIRLLPKTGGELLIVTKSYKDVLLLIKMGYNAISPSAEGTKINLNLFKDNWSKIVVWFDNDNAGLKNMQEHYLNEIKIHIPLNEPKDITDFVKKYGFNEGLNLTKQLIK